MLEFVHVKNVGPASEMRFEFGRRLNVITGDNGLGKSFVLDVAWWALTRTWAANPALPLGDDDGVIEYGVKGVAGSAQPTSSTFRVADGTWPLDAKRPPVPGIIVYIRIDGGFSVWDPARNYWRTDPGRPAAYHFSADQVWDGLDLNGQRACEVSSVTGSGGKKPESPSSTCSRRC